MAYIYIATEDQLSEAVAEKIVLATGHFVADKIPKDRRQHAGFGYLKVKLPTFVKTTQSGLPFLVLTDLDTHACPPELMADWFGVLPRPKRLLFRVAVREIEAWVLADRCGVATWLGISEDDVPNAPESSRDPKAELLSLAKKSIYRELKEGLLPKKGAISKVGLEYNNLLCTFVRKEWCIDEAALLAPSLERTIRRLSEFA